MEPRALPAVLEPIRRRPSESALFVDFDGTLAPIVGDPARARPLDGVPAVLERLARRLHLVAVVSGRPVAFLTGALGSPAGVHLAGLYGLEEAHEGSVHRSTEADEWRPLVDQATRMARRGAPPGAEVEAKGLTVTLHWRRAPAAADWAAGVQRWAEAEGLVAQPGRMAVELRPPVGADKGSVVARMGAGHAVVAFFGDDLGDLPAFAALDALAATGVAVARVAVADDESAPEVLAAADLVVAGPSEAVALLDRLAAP